MFWPSGPNLCLYNIDALFKKLICSKIFLGPALEDIFDYQGYFEKSLPTSKISDNELEVKVSKNFFNFSSSFDSKLKMR